MEIICYLSNGYPTIEASYNMAMEYADAGCKMMEVDFPSRVITLQEEWQKRWNPVMIMKNIWTQS